MFHFSHLKYWPRLTLGYIIRPDNNVMPIRLSYRFHVFIDGITKTRVNGKHENSLVQSTNVKLARVLNEKMLNIT